DSSFFSLKFPPITYLCPLSLHDALPISPLAVSGKQFRAGGGPVFVKAVTFGPFPEGVFPDGGLEQLARIREELGANALRLYEIRSEEHTSELQSRENLVCRLLLEKKKNR